MLVMTGAATAQDYPSKPIRIVTSEFGSATDLTARLLGSVMSSSLGRQVVVENRGFIAIEVVAKANADGYTVLCYGPPLWLAPLMRSVSYDVFKDFAPVTMAVTTPNVLVVHPALPVKSVGDLIALAKARPGELNYGSGSPGSSTHMAAELFKHMAGVDIVRVSYRGTGPAMNGLMSAQVQVMFPNAGAATPHVKSGRVRALAVSSAHRSALVPALPTIAESGVPGYESSVPLSFVVPAGTPRPIVEKLNREMVGALHDTEVKAKLFNSGVEVVASTPDELVAMVKADMTRMGKVIREAGIRDE